MSLALARATWRRWRASSSLRSRSAKISGSRPCSLSAGAIGLDPLGRGTATLDRLVALERLVSPNDPVLREGESVGHNVALRLYAVADAGGVDVTGDIQCVWEATIFDVPAEANSWQPLQFVDLHGTAERAFSDARTPGSQECGSDEILLNVGRTGVFLFGLYPIGRLP